MITEKTTTARDQQAFQGIAEAFALLKEHSSYVPEQHRTRLAHIEADLFFNDPKPFQSPDLIRRIVPAILAHSDAQEEDENEAGEMEDEEDESAAPPEEPMVASKNRSQARTPTDEAVFRNFITATADLLTCDATPKPLHEAIGDAITEAGNQLCAYDEYADDHARRVLSIIFGLPEAEQSKRAVPAPVPASINTFQVSAQFNELAERLAISVQNDDLLHDLIRFAFAIANESDKLNREAMALTVGGHAFTRTCEFSAYLDGIVNGTERGQG